MKFNQKGSTEMMQKYMVKDPSLKGHTWPKKSYNVPHIQYLRLNTGSQSSRVQQTEATQQREVGQNSAKAMKDWRNHLKGGLHTASMF